MNHIAALALALTLPPITDEAPPTDHLAWLDAAPFGIFAEWEAPDPAKADRLDAAAWAKAAEEAGAGYFLVTARRKDGVCLWDAPGGAKSAPPGRNLIRELSDACRTDGLRFGVGYALFDPSLPDPFRDIHKQSQTARLQIEDLLDRYPVDALWLSEDWPASQAGWRSRGLVESLATRRPSAFVNDHLGRDPLDAWVPPVLQTFEDEAPDSPPDDNRWIVRSRLAAAGEGAPLKPPARIIALLADSVSRGGGLLLTIEPSPDGAIPEPVLARLRGIGAWMKTNGEAIRGVEPSPFFQPLPSGPATTKGNTLYLVITDPPANRAIELPGLRTAVRTASVLDGGAAVPSRVEDGIVVISLPESLAITGGPAVIKVELDGPPVVE